MCGNMAAGAQSPTAYASYANSLFFKLGNEFKGFCLTGSACPGLIRTHAALHARPQHTAHRICPQTCSLHDVGTFNMPHVLLGVSAEHG